MPDLPNPAAEPPQQRKRRWLRALTWLFASLVVLLVACELIARYYFGLGDPPLTMYDPDMEYRFVPSRTYRRAGNVVHYNQWSQRADDFPQHKTDPKELRVMVIGDSVINGGAPTDQKDTCTALLQQKLREALHRNDVTVGNISAGSWGPPNQLAYLKRFGLFDADVVVFEWSDLDATDVMTWDAPIGSQAFPDHTPFSAIWEGIGRYLPGIWVRIQGKQPPPPVIQPMSVDEERAVICAAAIREMVAMARARGAKVILTHHHELPERLDPGFGPHLVYGDEQIQKTCRELGFEPIQWQAEFDAATKAGQPPYRERDYVHPSNVGNRIIGEAMFKAVMEKLREPATKPAG